MAAVPVRRTRGRQRVRMELMPIESNRAVTFSKRHNNLFKKANELCTLCGAEAAVIISSPGEKGFAYGHPSVDTILDRFLLGDGTNPILRQQNPVINEKVINYNLAITSLKDKLEEAKKRTDQLLEPRALMHVDVLKFLGPFEEFSLSELKQMQQSLDGLGNNVDTHRYLLEAQSHMMPMPLPRQDPIQMMMVPHSLVRGPNDNPPLVMVPTPLGIIDPSTMVRQDGLLGGPIYNPGVVFGNLPMAMMLSGIQGPFYNPGVFGDQSMTIRPSGMGQPLHDLIPPPSSFVPNLKGAGSSNPSTIIQAPHPVHRTDGQFDGRQGMPSSTGMINRSSALRNNLASFLMDNDEDNEDVMPGAFNPQGGPSFGSGSS